jgi:hypothetical protein
MLVVRAARNFVRAKDPEIAIKCLLYAVASKELEPEQLVVTYLDLAHLYPDKVKAMEYASKAYMLSKRTDSLVVFDCMLCLIDLLAPSASRKMIDQALALAISNRNNAWIASFRTCRLNWLAKNRDWSGLLKTVLEFAQIDPVFAVHVFNPANIFKCCVAASY